MRCKKVGSENSQNAQQESNLGHLIASCYNGLVPVHKTKMVGKGSRFEANRKSALQNWCNINKIIPYLLYRKKEI